MWNTELFVAEYYKRFLELLKNKLQNEYREKSLFEIHIYVENHFSKVMFINKIS